MKINNIAGLIGSSFLVVSVLSLPAIAGIINIGTPLYQGTEIDGTPWEWTGENWSETEAKQRGADLACQAQGYQYATSFTTNKGQQQGTWRFHTNGRLEWCDFCQWYITNLKCFEKRR